MHTTGKGRRQRRSERHGSPQDHQARDELHAGKKNGSKHSKTAKSKPTQYKPERREQYNQNHGTTSTGRIAARRTERETERGSPKTKNSTT